MPRRIIQMKDYFDHGSLAIILVTMILLVVALFVKGITKDLLLEIGIFLVSSLICFRFVLNKYPHVVIVATFYNITQPSPCSLFGHKTRPVHKYNPGCQVQVGRHVKGNFRFFCHHQSADIS